MSLNQPPCPGTVPPQTRMPSGPFVVTNIVGKRAEWANFHQPKNSWILIGITIGCVLSDHPLIVVDLPPNHASDRRRASR